MHRRIRSDVDGRCVRQPVRRLARHAEVGLHLAALFREHERQDQFVPEPPRGPRQGAGAQRRLVRRQRTAGFLEELRPPLHVPVLDSREAVEELPPLTVDF